MIERIRTVATAAVTYLVALASVLTIAADELGKVAGVPENITRALAVALVVIGTAVAIIRRVTTVLPAARGIVDQGTPATAAEAAALHRVAELETELAAARAEFP